MEQTAFQHPKLSMYIRTGSEGPRHDPYAYSETTVITPNGETVLHEGLSVWIKHKGKEVSLPSEVYDNNKLLMQLFRIYCGYSIAQLNRIHRKLRSRCRACGGRNFHEESGYPGETFTVCSDCGCINDSYFCRSAVE